MSEVTEAGMIMTYKALLNRYTKQDGGWREEPFTIAGYACATDSHIMVYMLNEKIGIERTLEEKRSGDIMNYMLGNSRMNIALDGLEVIAAIDICPKEEEEVTIREGTICGACKGNGTIEADFEYRNRSYSVEGECPVCNGSCYEVAPKTEKTGRMICQPYEKLQIGDATLLYKLFNELWYICQLLKQPIILQHIDDSCCFFQVSEVNIILACYRYRADRDKILYKITVPDPAG